MASWASWRSRAARYLRSDHVRVTGAISTSVGRFISWFRSVLRIMKACVDGVSGG